MESLELFLWVFGATLLYMWLRNRVRHAIYQKQKEDFWREVIRRTEQKKKIDALYGRNKGD